MADKNGGDDDKSVEIKLDDHIPPVRAVTVTKKKKRAQKPRPILPPQRPVIGSIGHSARQLLNEQAFEMYSDDESVYLSDNNEEAVDVDAPIEETSTAKGEPRTDTPSPSLGDNEQKQKLSKNDEFNQKQPFPPSQSQPQPEVISPREATHALADKVVTDAGLTPGLATLGASEGIILTMSSSSNDRGDTVGEVDSEPSNNRKRLLICLLILLLLIIAIVVGVLLSRDGSDTSESSSIAKTPGGTVAPPASPQPSRYPSRFPSMYPSTTPSSSVKPSLFPTLSASPTMTPLPSAMASESPSFLPSASPSFRPSTPAPSANPSVIPSSSPSSIPSTLPSTSVPSTIPSSVLSALPSTSFPSTTPSIQASGSPTDQPSAVPSTSPSMQASENPTGQPSPSVVATAPPSRSPTGRPTSSPTVNPTGGTASRGPTVAAGLVWINNLTPFFGDNFPSTQLQTDVLNQLALSDKWEPDDPSDSHLWMERFVLSLFYEAAGGNDWNLSGGWRDRDTGICDWFGVSCDSSDRVVSIMSQFNGLEGSLPSEIGLLGELRRIGLRSNRLQGTVPPQLRNLVKLEWLDLRNNRLEGAVPAGVEDLAASRGTEILLRGNSLDCRDGIPNLDC